MAMTMASLLIHLGLCLAAATFAVANFAAAASDLPSSAADACAATRFPPTCHATLSAAGLPPTAGPLHFISATCAASRSDLRAAISMAESVLGSAGANPNMTTAAKNCLELLSFSDRRISLASDPATLAAGRTEDARAWLSAALLYQYDCFSALKYVNTTATVNSTMSFLLGLTEQTSNALALTFAYGRFGADTASWLPPQTERDGYWDDDGGGTAPSPAAEPESEPGPSGSGYSGHGGGEFPAVEEADVTVCPEGCDFTAVQAAVEAAPANLSGGRRFVVYIKEGVYNETVRVGMDKTNLVFLGDGTGKTVITGNLNVAQMVGLSTYNTATVGVAGDGFMAEGITFENTAGPDAHQAVAFRSTSDFSVLKACEFLGHQDTLYAHSLRQYYYSCLISGTVDFIFGNSAAVFDHCLILVRPRQLNPDKGETNTITAHGRTDPGQSTGFVFTNCEIDGTEEYLDYYWEKPAVHKTYLGRPWKEYSRTVFLECYMTEILRPEGWLPWDGEFALRTLFYGEYRSAGNGANATARVPWSSQISGEHVRSYSARSFIQGNRWIPSGL